MARRAVASVAKKAVGGRKPPRSRSRGGGSSGGYEIDVTIEGMQEVLDHLDKIDARSRYEIEVGILDKNKRYPGKGTKRGPLVATVATWLEYGTSKIKAWRWFRRAIPAIEKAVIDNLIRYADVDELEFDRRMAARIGQEAADELRRSLRKRRLVDTGLLRRSIRMAQATVTGPLGMAYSPTHGRHNMKQEKVTAATVRICTITSKPNNPDPTPLIGSHPQEFCLRGANLDETIKALVDAGFTPCSGLSEAEHEAKQKRLDS